MGVEVLIFTNLTKNSFGPNSFIYNAIDISIYLIIKGIDINERKSECRDKLSCVW